MIKNKNLEQIINLFKNNQFDEALRLCDQNSDESIGHIILNFKGAIYFKQKNFELAKKNFLKSVELNENFIDPYNNLYLLHLKCEEFRNAINYAEKIIKIEKIKNPESYYRLAYACEMNGNYTDSINYYKISESLGFSNKKSLFNNLGTVYLKVNNTQESEKFLLKALEFNDGDKIIINNLLRCYLHSRNYKKAELYYKKAEDLDIENDAFKYNKIELLISQHKFEEAIDLLKKLVENTNNFLAPLRLASLYSRLGKTNEAETVIDNSLKIHPNDTHLKYSKGRIMLKKGDFDAGWKYFEFRKSKLNEKYGNINDWNGENLSDKNILVYNEQGIGDAIQFSKYLFALSKICREIDFIVDDKLFPLFKKNIEKINIYKKTDIIKKECDYKISLGSLIKFFYNKTDSRKDNLIYFNEAKKLEWKKKLDSSRLKVGIVWSGFFLGPNEPYRSIPLEKFSKILTLDVNFYSIQKEIWETDTKFYKESNIIKYGHLNLEEISGIIGNMDLIISTCGPFLHMSCALEKETWGLLSLNSDYRWGKLNDIDPYNSLKIYKQSEFNNWDPVLNNIEKDLIKKINLFK
jgi:tetratricopeptide (TPR) repeat protein|tara:strand:+ start:108 stop:1841 length:1734 start_codon:yes stop_codon:yes gene_type:complete